MNKARKMFEEELKAFEACTDEEMTALFKREKNDSEALNRFLEGNLHRAFAVASEFESEPVDFMDLIQEGDNLKYALNSKGKIVPVKEVAWGSPDETPTHLCLQFASSFGTAYVGAIGTTLWLDNLKFVY